MPLRASLVNKEENNRAPHIAISWDPGSTKKRTVVSQPQSQSFQSDRLYTYRDDRTSDKKDTQSTLKHFEGFRPTNQSRPRTFYTNETNAQKNIECPFKLKHISGDSFEKDTYRDQSVRRLRPKPFYVTDKESIEPDQKPVGDVWDKATEKVRAKQGDSEVKQASPCVASPDDLFREDEYQYQHLGRLSLGKPRFASKESIEPVQEPVDTVFDKTTENISEVEQASPVASSPNLTNSLNSLKSEEQKKVTMEQLAELCRITVQQETIRAGKDILRLESLRQMGIDIALSIAESIDGLYDKTFKTLQQKDNNRCEYCHRTCNTLKTLGIGDGKLTKDHIIPKALGGTGRQENIAYICQECNILKGNMLPWEWIRRLLAQPGPNRKLTLLRVVNVGLVTELMLHKLGLIAGVSESFKCRTNPEKLEELEKRAIKHLEALQKTQLQAQRQKTQN